MVPVSYQCVGDSTTFGGWDGSKHYSEFICELVNIFVGWLAIGLGNLECFESLFDDLFNAHGCSRLVN